MSIKGKAIKSSLFLLLQRFKIKTRLHHSIGTLLNALMLRIKLRYEKSKTITYNLVFSRIFKGIILGFR